jgi:SAM-dependent methyltransferase
MDEEAPPCCFDDWAINAAQRAQHRETVAPISTRLLRVLDDVGLDGRTVLDVGCGAGDLALATLTHGATHVSGIDLGVGAIEAARALAEERGSADRATFTVGDGSTAPLPQADVVVLNRVVCCFPNVDGLLENTLSATGRVYAVTAPVDRGVVGLALRLAGRLANLWYAARRKRYRGYRTYLHDVGAIDARVRAAGFETIVRERSRVVWDLAVYAR